jgi:hypothetical protein
MRCMGGWGCPPYYFFRLLSQTSILLEENRQLKEQVLRKLDNVINWAAHLNEESTAIPWQENIPAASGLTDFDCRNLSYEQTKPLVKKNVDALERLISKSFDGQNFTIEKGESSLVVTKGLNKVYYVFTLNLILIYAKTLDTHSLLLHQVPDNTTNS